MQTSLSAALLLLAMVAAVSLLLLPCAQARNITVCASGCNYASVVEATERARSADVVQVFAGTYDEDEATALAGKRLTLVSVGGEVRVDLGANNITILSPLIINGSFVVVSAGMIVNDTSLTINGALTLEVRDSSAGVGMWMQNNSKLVQNGNLTVKMMGASVLTGVRLEPTCTWKQAGQFETTQLPATELTGVWLGGTWEQKGPAKINTTGSMASSTGVSVQGKWVQEGDVELLQTRLPSANGTHVGVLLKSGVDVLWRQVGSVNINMSPGTPPSASYDVGVRFLDAPNAAWAQAGSVEIVIPGPNVECSGGGTWASANTNVQLNGEVYLASNTNRCQFDLNGAPISQLRCSGLPQANRITGLVNTYAGTLDKCSVTYLTPLASNVTATNPFVLAVVENAPVISIQPKDADATVRPDHAVTLNLAELRLIDTADAVLQVLAITSGSWKQSAATPTAPGVPNGQSLQFIATAVGGGQANVTFSFAQYVAVADVTAGGVNFTLTPAMAKLTVAIAGWPWNTTADPNTRMELRVNVGPEWASSSSAADTPQANMTTHTLAGQDDGQVTTTVRALSVAELDGEVVSIGQFVDDAAHQLVFVVPRPFASSLVYDPDFSVVLDVRKGGSDDNLALIIGVSVAIPVAVVIVLAVIVGAVVVAYVRRRNTAALGAVNFDVEEPNKHAL